MFLQNLLENPIWALVYLAIIVIAVTVHEYAHAKVADMLGDPTPRSLGRVSLNPLAHLDLFGSVFFLLFGFGWGKPVPFDPFNLRNPRKDSALISLAGPASNLLLVLFTVVLEKVLLSFSSASFLVYAFIGLFLTPLIHRNLILAFFNLIPIYPLDGFKVIEGLLPEEKAREWAELRRYGMIFLVLFILPIGGESLASKTIGVLVKVAFSVIEKILLFGLI